MANLCDTKLIIRGFKTKEDMFKFSSFLNPASSTILPLFDSCTEFSPKENKLTVDGWTKWTAQNLMGVKGEHIINIETLAQMFGVTIEILGTEPGFCFGEHYVIDENGKVVLDERFSYYEVFPSSYDSYEDFVSKNSNYPDLVEAVDKEEFEDLDFICVGSPDTEFGAYVNNMICPSLFGDNHE